MNVEEDALRCLVVGGVYAKHPGMTSGLVLVVSPILYRLLSIISTWSVLESIVNFGACAALK